MEVELIRTKKDYENALAVIETIFDAEIGTDDGDKLEVLTLLVEKYEENNFNIELPDPIESIIFCMEQKGLERKDLQQYIGSRGRVSEVINKKRPLTISMIRKLSSGLNISADLLIKDYELNCNRDSIC